MHTYEMMKSTNNTSQFEGELQFNMRWSEKKVNEWYSKNPWPVGCNYVPQYAINQLEMWPVESFDPVIIDKELGWAGELGFNTVRVFLHHLLWEQDSNAFLERMDKFWQ